MEAIKGNGMIYEMNKEYVHDGDVERRYSGYHYFDSIRDVMYMYCLDKSRLFECELNGDRFDHDRVVHCTNKIKLIREISKEDFKKYIEDNIDKLVNDKDWEVREEVVKYGYGLDILINDDKNDVRLEVAKQGYGLDKLINDKDWIVREEVAKHGYGLDKLINDADYTVRREVARQGYGLDILVNDGHEDVRLEVARHGYGLDKLVNDGYWFVRTEATHQLELRKNKEN